MTENKEYKKPLVYIDALAEDDNAGFNIALSYAAANKLSLKLLSVIDNSGWTLMGHSSDAETILDQTTTIANEKLSNLQEKAMNIGVQVEAILLHGVPFVEIIQMVKEYNHDIVIKTMNGGLQPSDKSFGVTAKRLLRKCPCAVLLAHPKLEGISRVAISIGSEDTIDGTRGINKAIIETGNIWSGFANAPLHVLHAWSPYGAAFLIRKFSTEEMYKYVEAERKAAELYLQGMLKTHSLTVPKDHLHLLAGEPQEVVPVAVSDASHDLLVLGSVARSGIKGLLLGNTAESILDNLRCSFLVVKPDDFVSPIV